MFYFVVFSTFILMLRRMSTINRQFLHQTLVSCIKPECFCFNITSHWKKKVEKEIEKISLKENALNRAKWRDGVGTIVEGMG